MKKEKSCSEAGGGLSSNSNVFLKEPKGGIFLIYRHSGFEGQRKKELLGVEAHLRFRKKVGSLRCQNN